MKRLAWWSNFPWSAMLHKLERACWALLLLTLPVTSFPYFPSGLGGKTLVRPLAAYPLIILSVLVILPRIFKRPLPRTFLPLLAFLIAAMLSSLISLTADIDALRGVTIAERLIRSMATLLLGSAFYFTIALLPQSWDDLRFSLRWLYAGFALALAWGSLQALYVIHYQASYFKLISQVQAFISSRKLFATRISGLTYEPKWFAEQICLLLLPWLLGSILSRRSLFTWRLRRFPRLQWLTVEWLLLAWASIVLLFTFSRTGLTILGVLVVFSFLIFRSTTHASKTSEHLETAPKSHPIRVNSRILLEAGLVICGLIAVFVLVGSQNPYFSRFWRYFTEAKRRNRTYLEYIAFDQRFTYWQTAFRMFESQPLMGVGLGNYAFYFDEMLPDRLYRQAEIIRQTTPEEGRDRLITPKSLPARLLAETGLLGTASFLAYLIAVTGCVLYLWYSSATHLSDDPDERLWGLGGLLALVAGAFVVFSMDSFARPEMWVIFGLVTAAAQIKDRAAHLKDRARPTRLD